MPAPKPKSLITRHETKAEQAEREERESAVMPSRPLPKQAPAILKGQKVASETWRRLVRMYSELEAEIVSRLDMDLLVDYCMLTQQVAELDVMRQSAYSVWMRLSKKHEELAKEAKTFADDGKRTEAKEKSELALEYATKVVGAFDAIVKLDARSERKRALLKQYRESLYMTPRARAGVAPKGKEPESEEDDPMDKLLNEVTDFVNGESGHEQ